MSQKKLLCPLCFDDEVERVKLTSPEGKKLVSIYIEKVVNERERKKLQVLGRIQSSEAIYIYHCLRCQNLEIWNNEFKKNLVKLSIIDTASVQARKKPQKLPFTITKAQKEIIYGLIIGAAIAFVAFYAFLYAMFFLARDQVTSLPIPFINTSTFERDVHVYVLLLVGLFVPGILVFSYFILWVIDKRISVLEFTMKLHQLVYGPHFYFLEYNAKYEKTSFVASLKRAGYGSTLVLGIAILILENFLIIPDLQKVFWNASYITLVSLAVSLPLLLIFLNISPLLTMEVNLYYFDKKDRIVRNVGSWLEDALHLLAVVDIIVTSIIILDSPIDPAWFLVILGFVLLVFVLFLVFTIAFNKQYHSRLKDKFIQLLKGKYNLPVRKASVFQQNYYCRNCGQAVDVVQQDRCANCHTQVHKCSICGEVVDVRHIVGKNVKGIDMGESNKITNLIDKMESKMSGGARKETPSIQCPVCLKLAHLDEFVAWLKLRGSCPFCKERLNFYDLF
nr:zinc ribbon domain-containing protein [Candidatus Sigynarchaeum springense]